MNNSNNNNTSEEEAASQVTAGQDPEQIQQHQQPQASPAQVANTSNTSNNDEVMTATPNADEAVLPSPPLVENASPPSTTNDGNNEETGAQEEAQNSDTNHTTTQANHSASANNNDNNHDDDSSSNPPNKKRKGYSNAGSKKGGKRVDRPQSFWYQLCEIYERGKELGTYKSQINFLRSADSGTEVNEDHRMHFSRAYKKFQNGTLQNVEETRARKRKYEPLERRLIQYYEEHQQQREWQQQETEDEHATAQQQQQQQQQQQFLYVPYNPNDDTQFQAPWEQQQQQQPPRKRRKTDKRGKSPLAWSVLQAKAKEWAKEMGLDDGFCASAGWIDNLMKRYQREQQAKQKRDDLDDTLIQRRDRALYSQKLLRVENELHRANQKLWVESKQLKMGSRVTVMDISQQMGDSVITQLNLLEPSRSEKNGTPSERPSVVVQRKRHGSTQTFPVHDVRKIFQHLPQEEDTATMEKLLMLLPRRPKDAFLIHTAQFPRAVPQASLFPRPIWESLQQQIPGNIVTSTIMLEYSDTNCAEKLNIHILKTSLLPMFRKDQKARENHIEYLQGLSQRNKVQQESLEILQYAQMTFELIRDLYEMVKDFPARGGTVVYQVDYQANDASLRGRLIAKNPAPFFSPEEQRRKSYAPRTLTLQAMPTVLHTALTGSFAHHIIANPPDMIMVHCLCNLARIYQASDLIPSWLDFQVHNAAWCDYIQNVHTGITKEQTKTLPQILLYGGTYDTWKQAMDEQTIVSVPAPSHENWNTLQTFIFRLTTEWRALRDVLLVQSQFAWTELDKKALLDSHVTAPAAILNVLMVRILHATEQEIWNIVARTFAGQGWKVRSKLLDGLLVEGPSPADDTTPVLAVAQRALQLRGWNVPLIEAPNFGLYTGRSQKEPLSMLQKAREVMNRMEESVIVANVSVAPMALTQNNENQNDANDANGNDGNSNPSDLDPTLFGQI